MVHFVYRVFSLASSVGEIRINWTNCTSLHSHFGRPPFRFTKHASGKCEMHNLAVIAMGSSNILGGTCPQNPLVILVQITHVKSWIHPCTKLLLSISERRLDSDESRSMLFWRKSLTVRQENFAFLKN